MNSAFSTADIGQASFLMVRGHRFLGAEHTGRDRVVFKFEDGGQPAAETALAFANNAAAPAKSLLEAMRYLKSILRDVRPNPNYNVERGRACNANTTNFNTE
jgi:hypothetical protein